MSTLEILERRIAAAVPLSAYRVLIRRDVLGLVYHAVSAQPLGHLRYLYPYKTPEMFERDLIYLKAHFNVISYDRLLAGVRGEARLEPGSILITFDDGYAECFTVVRPLLHKYGFPAVFFITTDFIDNESMFYRNKVSLVLETFANLTDRQATQAVEAVNQEHGLRLEDRQAFTRWTRALTPDKTAVIDGLCGLLGVNVAQFLAARQPYLTRGQIQALAAEGFAIGAHSRSHVKFNLLPPERVEAEIAASCRQIAEITGAGHVPFAFPFSGSGLDMRLLSALVAKYDFLDLLFDARGIRKEQPYLFDRIWADPPPDPQAQGSNLASLLHQAYQDHALWRRRYLQSMVKRRLKL